MGSRRISGRRVPHAHRPRSDIDVHATTSEDKLFGDLVSAMANKRAAVVFTSPTRRTGQLEKGPFFTDARLFRARTAVDGNDATSSCRNTSIVRRCALIKYDAEYDAHASRASFRRHGWRVPDSYRRLPEAVYSTTIVHAAS